MKKLILIASIALIGCNAAQKPIEPYMTINNADTIQETMTLHGKETTLTVTVYHRDSLMDIIKKLR